MTPWSINSCVVKCKKTKKTNGKHTALDSEDRRIAVSVRRPSCKRGLEKDLIEAVEMMLRASGSQHGFDRINNIRLQVPGEMCARTWIGHRHNHDGDEISDQDNEALWKNRKCLWLWVKTLGWWNAWVLLTLCSLTNWHEPNRPTVSSVSHEGTSVVKRL